MKRAAPLLILLAGMASAAEPPRAARQLIVHADDLGFSHSVNATTIRAFESGAVNSASLMVPCPWFPEIAAWAREHPEADLGLHLTLTSERTFYRWGPVASSERVPSLLDKDGYFLQDWPRSEAIQPVEAERELRAQVARALAMGVRPTHLDSHQFRLFASGPALFEVLLRVGRDLGLPVLVARSFFAEWPYLQALLRPSDVVIDQVVTISPDVKPEGWAGFYENALRNLPAGVTELVIHLARDDEEMQAMTRERPTWGAAWRQRDTDFFMSPRFKELLREQGVRLVTWRELGGPR
jgi:predicted glycoside hydrolase/deacetylase ChbG (UPF0249 family)